MATTIGAATKRNKPLTPDTYEKILAVAAMLLFAAVIAAIVRGHPYWARIQPIIWVHLLTIMIALALTPTMLLRRHGDARHRRIGTIWVVAMLATAASSFFVRLSNPGGFSPIHILSVWTMIQVPIIWWTARHHNIARHRGAVRGMVTGALLIAGFFTFPFHRMLGEWLFG